VKKTQTERKAKRSSSVRIISGKWRRRSLPVADIPGLRPTGDRMRETLFNWLMHHVNGARCLDLFAGTGALGLEALSRGANFVHFVEKNREAARILQQNLKELDAERNSFLISESSAENTIAKTKQEPFDIVFIDPPFNDELWNSSFGALESNNLLTEGALVYVEMPKDANIDIPSTWIEKKRVNAGNVQCLLLEKH